MKRLTHLYEHQKIVLERAQSILDKRGLVYLAMSQRTGKTPTALALIGENTPCVFVTRKKAISSIESDIESFRSDIQGDITVINYESIHKLPDKNWKAVILDESHNIGSYPKTTKTQKAVAKLFSSNPEARAILLSGTPNIETHSQLFHQFRVTGKHWKEFRSFYAWFSVYGIKKQIMVRGRLVNDYSETKAQLIMQSIQPFFVTCTQDDAGFKVKSELCPVLLDNQPLSAWIESFAKSSVHYFSDFIVFADGAASVLSKSLQACGGTIINDEDEAEILPAELHPRTKVDWLVSSLESFDKVCIFTNFIAEREFLSSILTDSTDCMETFKTTPTRYFIGSLESYCEGVDLSRIENMAMVIYSLSWRGKTLDQVLARQNNKLRADRIQVFIPLIKDTPEIDLYNRVAIEKRNFNTTFYKSLGQ